MISYTELQTRFARYVDAEVLTHLTGGRRILLGSYTALAAKNAEAKLRELKDKPLISITGAVQENGIDVDALWFAAAPYIDEPVTLTVPAIGDFRLGRADWEKLYKYLKGEL